MTPYEATTMLALLFAGHALADYPLQGDFLAKAKNRFAPIPGVPWVYGLLPHAAIHGACVGLITGSLTLGVAEFVVHCIIDDAKCAGRFGFHVDQMLHLICKILWVALLWQFGASS